MKILLLDIETAPNTAHVWGLFKQNISISQLMDSSYVMCWSAKWLGEERVMFDSVHKSKPHRMLNGIYKLLEEADVVVHYNGTRFDIPTLNKEFLLHDMKPPATYRQVDLLKTARGQFRFPSNKLDYVAKALGVGGKIKHSGHDLWVRCMAGENAAWSEMEEYNKNDVTLLEQVYFRLLPWIKGHPNHAQYVEGENEKCPNCGGEHLHKRGYSYTAVGKFQRYQCNACGAWGRSRKAIAGAVKVVNDRS